MPKAPVVLCAVLFIAVVGWLCWELAPPREPSYWGKPLSFWLTDVQSEQLNRNLFGVSLSSQAEQAIHKSGTNAVPALLRLLRANDPPWENKLIELARKQHLIKIQLVTASEKNMAGMMGFSCLEPDAQISALPALIEILSRNLSQRSEYYTACCLGTIGPSAKGAVPMLVTALTNENANVRLNVARSLGQIHSDPELAVPALLKTLAISLTGAPTNQLNSTVVQLTIHALGAFGADARTAVPALFELARNHDPTVSPGVRWEAREALKNIDPEAAATAGVE